jgi:prophage antirepressor-like protein
MNHIQIFQNEQFGKVRVTMDNNNEPLFCLADVAKALGYNRPADAVNQHCKGVVVLPTPTSGGTQNIKFGKEGEVYRLTMKSKLPEAEKFQDWVCNDVLPSIRKHGAYLTEQTLEKALLSPDYLIRLATQIKEEQQKRIEAEEANKRLLEANTHQEQVIEGLVSEIPLADMRQRITQIVRKGSAGDIGKGYRLLYNEFNYKFHVNVFTRMNNALYKGSAMDYIEKEMNKLPDLYDLACKLFENTYEGLMESWGKSARRAEHQRNLSVRQKYLS